MNILEFNSIMLSVVDDVLIDLWSPDQSQRFAGSAFEDAIGVEFAYVLS
jgi:hypothetical protein